VLVQYGFTNLLRQIHFPTRWIRRVPIDGLLTKVPQNNWQRIRYVCEALGPTFVKIGQILSSRPDLLPAGLVEELKQLRDNVDPTSFDDMQVVLDAELGKYWGEIFSSIEPKPVGSASLAQVHKGVLRSTREAVAVKIQRPNVENDLQADLEILSWLAKELHQRVDELKSYDLPAIVRVLRKGVLSELDFRNEADNAKIFLRDNPHIEYVFCPGIYDEFTSKRLLVMELVMGDSPGKTSWGSDRKRLLAQQGGESLFHQIIVRGVFHADPHPGNIKVTEDGRLCLLDWGLTGQLTKQMRWILADLLDAVVNQDTGKIVRVAREINNDGGNPFNEAQLEIDVSRVLNQYSGDFNASQAGDMLLAIARALGRNGVDLTRDYTLLTKAIVSVEETGRLLDPSFNLASIARPFLKRLKIQRLNPERVIGDLLLDSHYVLKNLSYLPADFRRLLGRIDREDLSINLRLDKLDRLAGPLNQALNRVVIGLIIGSLIIGSSMIMTTGTGPLLWGFPQIGLLGYLLSAMLGLWIVFDILRNGRHR
jgi:ubiquinone biosynthesis protein